MKTLSHQLQIYPSLPSTTVLFILASSHILFSGFSSRRDIVATTGYVVAAAAAAAAAVADVPVVSSEGAAGVAGPAAADVESSPFVDPSDMVRMRLQLRLDGPRIIKEHGCRVGH